MGNSSILWVEAGKKLSKNPNDKVDCPECGKSTLLVKDVFNDKNLTQFERYLSCEVCKSYNVIRMNKG